MGATDLIFKLRNDGYSISADGGFLDISPADDLSPELVRQLKLGKPEILCALDKEEKARTSRPSAKNLTVTKYENPLIRDEKLHELDLLIQYVAEHNDFSEADIEEAKYHANKEVELALTSFRALARDIRRDRALAILQANPDVPRALYTDTESDAKNIILAIAVRHVAVTEMTIPREKYDPWRLITVLDKEIH